MTAYYRLALFATPDVDCVQVNLSLLGVALTVWVSWLTGITRGEGLIEWYLAVIDVALTYLTGVRASRDPVVRLCAVLFACGVVGLSH